LPIIILTTVKLLFTNYRLVSCYIINYRLSDYRSGCLGYRTHRPAEEQDPSPGDPRGEVPPSRGQNCGHEGREDHRGGNLPSAAGPGQGVRGFSHPVHTGIKHGTRKIKKPNSFLLSSALASPPLPTATMATSYHFTLSVWQIKALPILLPRCFYIM
jgi:hypothetical protein